MWLDLFSQTLDCAALNSEYLVKRHKKEFMCLEANLLEEIVERALKFNKASTDFDNSSLIEVLIKIRNC
jgi:hypothetical protein